MKLTRTCKVSNLNWAALPELRENLQRAGFKVESVRDVTLYRVPDSVEYASLEEAAEDALRDGAPDGFYISLIGSVAGDEEFQLRIMNFTGSDTIKLDMSGLREKSQLDTVMEFLGLEPWEPPEEPVEKPSPPRTAFIAHKFDEAGDAAASKLKRFLELLDFHVVTGRTYSPRPISGKVLALIEGQELCFVVLTAGGDDETWLTQESAIASVKDKDVFVIKDQNANFKSGILADVEYIEFVMPNIEDAFIRVLEGLDDLGYLAFQ